MYFDSLWFPFKKLYHKWLDGDDQATSSDSGGTTSIIETTRKRVLQSGMHNSSNYLSMNVYWLMDWIYTR